MASRVSFSLQPSTGAQATTPARSRRLSNFHKLLPSPPDAKLTPFSQRTPLRPFNSQTPATTPRRQSFAPKNFHPTSRLSPSNRHLAQRPKQPHLSKAEVAQMYSSTIKLCQDNKINTRNTWTLNLIDYMSMLVKDGQESDNVSRTVSFQDDLDTPCIRTADTNFQLAGATLDAGVKIYCSRVDSVHTNAFKVLGGLSRTGSQPMPTLDEDSDPNHQFTNLEKGRHCSAKRAGRSTLETNLVNITSHKHETDLAVDPLFHKMSAAFDEGGAKGMLMNNLPVGPQGQVLFDSNEPAEEGSLTPRQQQAETNTSQPFQTYCISELLPTGGIEDKDGICCTFLRFYGAKRKLLDISDSSHSSICTQSSIPPSGQSESLTNVDEDMFHDCQGLGFHYDDCDLQNTGELGVFSTHDPIQDISALQDEDEVRLLSTDEAGFRRNSSASNGSVAMAAQRGGLDLLEAGMALQANSSYVFFDTSSLSGWAGPQHWRFRAINASVDPSSRSGFNNGSKKIKRPRGKTSMLLDFFSAVPTVDFAKEFEPGKTDASSQLSFSVRDGFSEKKVTLPEDLHYSVHNLTGLFLKPDTIVKAKNAYNENGSELLERLDGDEWYDFENDCDNYNYCLPNKYDSFDDKDEQSGILNIEENDVGVKLIDEPTRVERIDINYATIAKRVDVRELKSGLWSKLCGESLNPDFGEDDKDSRAMTLESDDKGDLDGVDIRAGGSQRLQSIVSEMPAFVPAASLSDVSLPYVFICLLHLANERTLKITQEEDDSLRDLIITSDEIKKG